MTTQVLRINIDIVKHFDIIESLKKIFASKSLGFVVVEGFVCIIVKGLSASAFTGLMGSLGGLAVGSAIIFGLLPFIISFLWKAFWSTILSV